VFSTDHFVFSKRPIFFLLCCVKQNYFQAGIILCCLGLAIFGITEVPTEGVEFDTCDFVELEGSTESLEGVGGGGGGSGVGSGNFVPPMTAAAEPAAAAAAASDPDLEGSPSEPPRIPTKHVAVSSMHSEVSTIKQQQQQEQQPLPAAFHELD
jgi:hypothetical protein